MINSSAGTIANYVRAGHRVTLVTLTAGEKGNPSLNAEAYRRLKVGSWEKGAALLGVTDVRTLGWKDAELPHNDEVVHTCCDITREVQADLVVTHWKGSFHKDHVATYHSVMDAVFLAVLPTFERRYPAYAVKRVYFSDNWEDWEGFTPDTYVDITDTLGVKLEAIAEFMKVTARGGFDYHGFYQALARVRGCLSGCFTYDEAYATASPRPGRGKWLLV